MEIKVWLDWVFQNKEWLFSGVGLAVFGFVVAWFKGRNSVKHVPSKSGGGAGGKAEIIAGEGEAYGGKGGRGGGPFGPGGDGGDARIVGGKGKAVAGKGGDAA